MPRRLFVLAFSLFLVTMTLRAESPGERELALGRQSLARRDYGTAAERLAAATAALDPQKEREALAEAWLQLGIVDLTGLDRPEDALVAFRKSAELSGNPSAWLWASTAAEKLGRAEEAREDKARAIGSPQPPVTLEAAPPPPPPMKPMQKTPEIIPGPTPPEPAPVVQAAPPPVAEAAPVEPVKKGDAFQHLFGESSPERPAGARKLEEKKEKKTPEAPAGTPKVDAFQHFFGEKKKESQTGDEKDGAQSDKKTPEESSPPPG
jgi:tetratricopeptide (TPR) repeat protein